MTGQMVDLNIQEDVLSLRIENKVLWEVNANLEAQNKKMRNCVNCKHSEEDNKSSTICDECFELSHWELKE